MKANILIMSLIALISTGLIAEETHALDGEWVCHVNSSTDVVMYIGSDRVFEARSFTNGKRTSFAEGDVLVKLTSTESSQYGERMVGFLRVLSYGDYNLYEHQYRYYYNDEILMLTPQGETKSQKYFRKN